MDLKVESPQKRKLATSGLGWAVQQQKAKQSLQNPRLPFCANICRSPGGVEELLMANHQLPDVCEVVHAMPLLDQDLFGIPVGQANSASSKSGLKQDWSPNID